MFSSHAFGHTMDSVFASPSLYFASLVAILVACVLLLRKSRSPPLQHPPGPPALPIIGHLHLLGSLPHQSLHTLSRVYGPLMRLRFGALPAVVVSSPEVAREILQTHETAFLVRPYSSSAVRYGLFGSLGFSFSPYSPQYRLVRQLCVTHLFSHKSIESMQHIINDEMAVLVRYVYEDCKSSDKVWVLPMIKSAANNIISRMAFGKRFSELVRSDRKHTADLGDLLQELVHLIGVFNIGDFIPFLQHFDRQGFVRRMKTVGMKLSAVSQEMLNVRREERRTYPSSPKDLLDVLLSVNDDSKRQVTLTDDIIKGVIVDLFAAGTDTTSIALEWALAEVLKNPPILMKLQKDLDDVVGNGRLVKESDIPHLPYLRAVVKESMRLHPAIPFTAREATEASRICGYDIAPNTLVFLNIWAIGRDPGAWEKPLEFLPERFLESSVDVRGQHFQLLPFGSGRRGCPGMTLGFMDVQLMLANLLHAFDWIPQETMNLAENPGLTVGKAERLLATATPRLPLHVY